MLQTWAILTQVVSELGDFEAFVILTQLASDFGNAISGQPVAS
jgi:hypothetical protein